MIAPDLLSMLLCPTCQAGSLEHTPGGSAGGEGALRCVTCGGEYPVNDDVPRLFPRRELEGGDWRQWSDHLDKFQARRQARVKNPNWLVNRVAAKSHPQPSFGQFVKITEGAVLDVGCGPGNFRYHLDTAKVRYVGLDPIAMPEARGFPFVQGLAEYLPFKDDTFTDIVVLAALDHFRDLPRFLEESRRVLRQGGRLHIMQSVHEVRGPVSAVKVAVHKVKDALEDGVTSHGRGVPKHLGEYTDRSLLERLTDTFEVASTGNYSATWYSPDKLFISLTPKAERAVSVGALPS